MIICLGVTSHLRQKQMTNIHVTRGGKRTHKELQVSSTDQTIASVVAWSTDHQHRGSGLDQWGEWVSLRRGDLIYSPAAQLSTDCSSVWPEPHPCDGCGTAESSQFHQLVHAEAVLREELLVDVLRLLLPAQNLKLSVDQQTVCVCVCLTVSLTPDTWWSEPWSTPVCCSRTMFLWGRYLKQAQSMSPSGPGPQRLVRSPGHRSQTELAHSTSRGTHVLGKRMKRWNNTNLKKKKKFLYERLQAEYL